MRRCGRGCAAVVGAHINLNGNAFGRGPICSRSAPACRCTLERSTALRAVNEFASRRVLQCVAFGVGSALRPAERLTTLAGVARRRSVRGPIGRKLKQGMLRTDTHPRRRRLRLCRARPRKREVRGTSTTDRARRSEIRWRSRGRRYSLAIGPRRDRRGSDDSRFRNTSRVYDGTAR